MISQNGIKYLQLKGKTDRDIRSLGPIVQFRDQTETVIGQTDYSLSFAVPTLNKQLFKLHIDGILLREGSGSDFTFIEITNGASSKIRLTVSPVSILNMDYELCGVRIATFPTPQVIQANVDDMLPRVNGKIVTKSASYVILDTDLLNTILVDDTSSTRTITLPTAADNTNRIITIKNISTNKGIVTVDGEGAETIDSYTTINLDFKNAYIKVQSNGTSWVILSDNITSPQKQYSMTVTGSNWTTTRAIGIPYRMIDGLWRLRINITGGLSSTTSSFTGAITGVVFKNSDRQSGSGYVVQLGVAVKTIQEVNFTKNTNNFNVVATDIFDLVAIDGDIELESKPTFVE